MVVLMPRILHHSTAIFAVVLIGSAVSAAGPPPAQQVTVTYLANEGVMINCNGQKVLVDALFRDSVEDYVRHSPEEQQQIETGKAPFDGVHLALATHYHLDHWDPGSISRFLRNNPTAVFASTPEATAMLPYELRERFKALRPKPGSPAQMSAAGASVQAFRLGHDKAPNLGYRISICGKTFAHLGDADDSDASFRALMEVGPVDVAMVPFWWFLSPPAAKFLTRGWKPRQIIAFHLGTKDAAYAEQVHKNFPQVWVCTKQGEERKF